MKDTYFSKDTENCLSIMAKELFFDNTENGSAQLSHFGALVALFTGLSLAISLLRGIKR